MITLSVSGAQVKVYDILQYSQFLKSIGIESIGLEDVNSFTYATLPEGSHGQFLIKASDVATLATGSFNVKVTFTGATATFEYLNLVVYKVIYLDVPSNATSTTNQLAIVYLKDNTAKLSSIITKDFNRVVSGGSYSSVSSVLGTILSDASITLTTSVTECLHSLLET